LQVEDLRTERYAPRRDGFGHTQHESERGLRNDDVRRSQRDIERERGARSEDARYSQRDSEIRGGRPSSHGNDDRRAAPAQIGRNNLFVVRAADDYYRPRERDRDSRDGGKVRCAMGVSSALILFCLAAASSASV
jgi:hypothetical protein